MSRRQLQWRTLIGSRNPLFSVKGQELAVAFAEGHRFAIYEVRAEPDNEGNWQERYVVRDAYTVSDDEVKAGVRPRVVFEADSVEKVLDWFASAG